MRSAFTAFLLGTALSGFASEPQRPRIIGIAHVALRTQNMAAERTFYTQKLGWAAVASPEFADGVRFYGDPRQTVELHPGAGPVLEHVALRTSNVEAMRLYLKSNGIPVPAHVSVLRDGERVFDIKDPEGNGVEFVEGAPSAGPRVAGGVSGRIIHAGFIVQSAAAEDRFYKDILGFHPYWAGGMKDGTVDWQSMQVPDGTDWVEYMLHIPANASPQQVGVQDHFALGVADMGPIVAELEKRGWTPSPNSHKQMGRDGKVQLNLYDPDLTRVEFMEFKPRQTPCCSPITGREPSGD